MAWIIKNNWADLAHLQTSDDVTNSKFETETQLRLQLYTGLLEVDLDECRYTVGFKKMTLQLECHGTEIVLGERFGDYTPTAHSKDVLIEATKSVEAKASAGGTLDASTALSGAPLKAEASGSVGSGVTQKSTEARTETRQYVTSRPNDKWEISSPDGLALAAKHLTPDNVLCSVKPIAKRNRNAIQAHLLAHKHDLVVGGEEPKKAFSWLTSENRNKDRVFKVLMGKILEGGKEDLPKSQIQLSVISSVFSDDE